jgi:NAD(P)-dependent dehydrogenase (short-subunit alcohol dehydrogenase family)
VERLFREARDRCGRVDILVNNAAVAIRGSFADTTEEEFDRVFAVNARGVFLGTKFVLPTMLAQGRGVIVNTASIAGMVGLRDRAAYCASKGAVIALTKQVAVQYADAGVRCSCICPGTVDSPWVGHLLDSADDPVAARAALVARQPIGRLGTAEEVAAAALYLASDDAAFATGTALVIDGGITAG